MTNSVQNNKEIKFKYTVRTIYFLGDQIVSFDDTIISLVK